MVKLVYVVELHVVHNIKSTHYYAVKSVFIFRIIKVENLE